MRDDELMREAKELGAPLDLIRQVAKTGKLPVPNFSAGGIATPADAALVRSLGAEAVFVGSGIFKSSDPEARATIAFKNFGVTLVMEQLRSSASRNERVSPLLPGTASSTFSFAAEYGTVPPRCHLAASV